MTGWSRKARTASPSLGFDTGAINDLLWPLFPAGFYYKTFLWPAAAWKSLYEPVIRRMAGLGKAPKAPDRDRYAQLYAHCEVLVVGAGPAGLAAALAAAESGKRVMLCDEQAEPGGSLLADRDGIIDGSPATDWLARTLATLRGKANVTILPRTTAFGWYPHNFLGLAERVTDHLAAPDRRLPRERLWQVRAAEVVLATGAHERPLVFPDNDRPGIMLADAARTYAARYGVRPGGRALVATAHDSAYRAALELARDGVSIQAIADLRPDPQGPLVEAARAAGIRVLAGHTVCGTAGRLRVSSADVAPVTGNSVGARQRIPCDLVLMSGGFTPSIHLFSQSRGTPRWEEGLNAFVPDRSVEQERSAGACRGIFDLAAAVADGSAAGEAASGRGTCSSVPVSAGPGFIGALPHDRKPERVRAFLDFQNDVTAKDVKLAVQEGFRSIEHIKRYTTAGMATDQGKGSNLNALAIAAAQLDQPIPAIGLTTFRPPYTPVTFGTLAGRSRGALFDPVRTTPTHGWAASNGAVFEDVGQWKRARYFPRAGEDMHLAVGRECLAVRNSLGIFDASTLGKIEIVGADAAEFMNRMYVNPWTKLEPGRCRYGIMLREDGAIMDDGVVGRLAPDRFHVTTTTGGAAAVLQQMEDYLQTEWPDLDVFLTSVTEQWAVIALQGPRSREVLAPLVEGIDLSREAMPHMAVRTGRICGVPTRLFRVSFTGELGFEVNVPAGHGRAVWEALYAAGRPHGVTPYGTEAMHVLRAEKGFIIVGQETDGTVMPDDAGLTWAIGKAKKDFVGKRSLARASMSDPNRKQLVGLLTSSPNTVLEEGAQIVADPKQKVPMTMLGHVTSSYFSAPLGHSIALALVAGGRARKGETLYVPLPSGDRAGDGGRPGVHRSGREAARCLMRAPHARDRRL